MLSFSRSDLAVEKDNINGWIGILILATTVAFWFGAVFPFLPVSSLGQINTWCSFSPSQPMFAEATTTNMHPIVF